MRVVWFFFFCFAIGTSNGHPKGSTNIDPKTGLQCMGKCPDKDDEINDLKNVIIRKEQELSERLLELKGLKKRFKSLGGSEKSLLPPNARYSSSEALHSVCPHFPQNELFFILMGDSGLGHVYYISC